MTGFVNQTMKNDNLPIVFLNIVSTVEADLNIWDERDGRIPDTNDGETSQFDQEGVKESEEKHTRRLNERPKYEQEFVGDLLSNDTDPERGDGVKDAENRNKGANLREGQVFFFVEYNCGERDEAPVHTREENGRKTHNQQSEESGRSVSILQTGCDVGKKLIYKLSECFHRTIALTVLLYRFRYVLCLFGGHFRSGDQLHVGGRLVNHFRRIKYSGIQIVTAKTRKAPEGN